MIYSRQPSQLSQIDFGNPIARGLCFAYNAVSPAFEIAERRVSAGTGGGGILSGFGRFGRFVKANAGRRYWTGLTISAEYTVVAVVLDSTGRGAIRNPLDSDNGSGAGRNFQLRFSATNFAEFIPFNTTPTPFSVATSVTSSATELSVLAGTVDKAQLATVWLNGVPGASSTITGTPNTIISTEQVSVCGRTANADYFSGEVYAAFIFNRALSAAELKSLSANPWQLFAYPKPQRKFFNVVGGPTYTLAAAVGAFTLSGVAAALKAARQMVASAGSFTLTGVDAGVKAGRKITAEAGSFALTGNAADLVYSGTGVTYTLTAATGAFSLTGVDAGLKVSRKISAATGTFTLSGVAATLQVARKLVAATGDYSLTGVAAALKAARKMSAATGSYTLTGNPATLQYGSTTYKATVLLNGIVNKIPQAQVGTGLKPIVWVANRFRQRQVSEGTPLIFDPITKRWRLLQAGETLEV